MCDYSLHNVPNRLAVEGEPLQIHRFPTGSLGLAASSDLGRSSKSSWSKQWRQTIASWFKPAPAVPAVCIPTGTHLVVRDIPLSLQKGLGVNAEEEVIFTRLGVETNAYHDGVRFNNGQEVLLQRLPVGLHLDVLGLLDYKSSLQQLEAEEVSQVLDQRPVL